VPEQKLPLIVADTNVIVSALLGKSLRIFLELLSENKFALVFSELTCQELFSVLKRPKFQRYFTHQDY